MKIKNIWEFYNYIQGSFNIIDPIWQTLNLSFKVVSFRHSHFFVYLKNFLLLRDLCKQHTISSTRTGRYFEYREERRRKKKVGFIKVMIFKKYKR